jgi:hypothetical protein
MRELLGLAGEKFAWVAIYAVAGILALYWVGLGVTVWRLRRREQEKKAYPPVSILVATHRPGEGKRFLEGLRTLRYAAPWEVVMVLDRLPPGARREIDEVVKRVAFPVQVVAVQETAPGWSPKKYALAKGLERVRYEWVVVLDADVEVSQTYLGSLMGEVAEGVDAVVGLGWLRGSGVAAWEAALIQIESVGRAAWGGAYMATGRGWAVRKGYLLMGLYLWREVLSGDDDLTLQLVPQGRVRATGAETMSEAPAGWCAHLRRKQRHVQTGRHYGLGLIVSLGIGVIGYVGLWVVAAWQGEAWAAPLLVWGARGVAVRISRAPVGWWSWVWDPLVGVMQLGYPLLGLRRVRRW